VKGRTEVKVSKILRKYQAHESIIHIHAWRTSCQILSKAGNSHLHPDYGDYRQGSAAQVLLMQRSEYLKRCRARYAGQALADARMNFAHFADIQQDLREILAAYRRDPWLCDLAGRCHNPSGSIQGALWQYADSLGSIADFEEHFQCLFLRRGLVIYCELLMDDLKAANDADPHQILVFE
jgi:hypothetical protein